MRLRIVTLRERPGALAGLRRIQKKVWPPGMAYINEDAVCVRLWPALLRVFPEFQIILCDAGGRVVAGGYTIPFVWDGRTRSLPMGVDGVLERGLRDHRRRRRPNTLSALLAVVDPRLQGRGLSAEVLEAMTLIASILGMRALVAPVRPTLKHRYPLIPMERYARWRRPDGAPFDPWLRVHWRLGARMLGVAARSMVVEGRVKQWEAWTGMRFPASGEYIVPGALAPVRIDRGRDRGRYVEPNVWMLHPTALPATGDRDL